jgi:hypothetical protein
MKRMHPNIIYHLVPIYVYKKSINRLKNYNCKGFENSNFIHSTWDLKELKRIADLIFTKSVKYPQRPEVVGKFYEKPPVKFILLKIDRREVKARMGFVKPSYYHIYGSIPMKAYKIINVKRDAKGRFHF